MDTHIGDDNVHSNSEQHVYNFDRNSESNADGKESENEQASDELLSDSEDSDKSDENTFVLNIISDSVTNFPRNEEVLAGNNNPLVNITLGSGRTATRFFRETLEKFTK